MVRKRARYARYARTACESLPCPFRSSEEQKKYARLLLEIAFTNPEHRLLNFAVIGAPCVKAR